MNQKQKKQTANILILGLGSHPQGSGVGATKFFVKQGDTVRVTDRKSATDLAPALKALAGLPVTYHLGGHQLRDIRWADRIIQNPAVPFETAPLRLARKLGKKIDTDLTVFLSGVKPRVIGISGTRGKSTTTALVHYLLLGRYPAIQQAGNIGVSPLLLRPQPKENALLVLELSSWMLEGLARLPYSPPIGVLTNIYPDHLDRYGSMTAYRRAKQLLFANQKKDDWAIVFDHQKELRKRIKHNNIFTFSGSRPVKQGVGVIKGWFVFTKNKRHQRIAPITSLRLPGSHNLHNAAAALTVARLLGLSPTVLRRRLQRFTGLPHRLQFVREHKAVRYINDSHSTTPVAVGAAVASFSSPVVLIAGGKDKKLPLQPFVHALRHNVRELILLPGTTTARLLKHRKQFARVIVNRAPTLSQAVTIASRHAQAGDTVLLSPGATSFNQFRNAEERGDEFIKRVRSL